MQSNCHKKDNHSCKRFQTNNLYKRRYVEDAVGKKRALSLIVCALGFTDWCTQI